MVPRVWTRPCWDGLFYGPRGGRAGAPALCRQKDGTFMGISSPTLRWVPAAAPAIAFSGRGALLRVLLPGPLVGLVLLLA